jgi:hypothetical protein
MSNRLIPVYHENGCVTLKSVDITEITGESFENLKDASDALLNRGLRHLGKDVANIDNWYLNNNCYHSTIFFNETFQRTIDDIVSGKIKSIDDIDYLSTCLVEYINNNTNVNIQTINGRDYSKIQFRFNKPKKPGMIISKNVKIEHRRAVSKLIKQIVQDKEKIELLFKTSSTDECNLIVKFVKKYKLVTITEFKKKLEIFRFHDSTFERKSFKEKCVEYFRSIV